MQINKLNKIAVVAAVIFSIITLLFIVFAFNSGKNPYGPFTLIQCATLAFYSLVCGIYIRAFKDELNFGFKQAGIFALIITIGSSFMSLILGLIYIKSTWDVNFPIYHQNMVEFYTSMYDSGEMEKIGEVDHEALNRNIEALKKVTAFEIVFNDFSLKMIISMIISFIIAVVLRKSISKN